MPTLDQIIKQMEQSAETARTANVRRQQQAEAIYDEIIARYGPAGTYGRAAEALLERQKVGAVGAGTQHLISTGLYGTEVGGGLGRAWEAEVGAPARLRLEDIKMERLSQAQLGKAGFVERIEDVYPDYGMMMQYLSQAANVPAAPAAGAAGGYGGVPAAGGYGGYSAGGGYGGGAGFGPDVPRKYVPGLGMTTDWGAGAGAGAGGFRGALYGQEPVTGGMYGPGGEELISPTAKEKDLDYWLSQGYTGYIGDEATAGFIDWTKGGRGTNRAQGIFVPAGTREKIQADPATGKVVKKGQFPAGGGVYGGYSGSITRGY